MVRGKRCPWSKTRGWTTCRAIPREPPFPPPPFQAQPGVCSDWSHLLGYFSAVMGGVACAQARGEHLEKK